MHAPVAGGPAGSRSSKGSAYRRREPEKSLLHEVVRGHLETFLANSRERENGLPVFVERELRAYLDCGLLCRGFIRVRCESCGDERLVAFSCKSRSICSSCATRRMYDGAAFLVRRVLPRVPFRQWVMSFPKTVRLRLALDAKLTSRVLGIFLRTVFAWQRKQARRLGCRRAGTGAITFVQRFSSALRLNVHFHCLVPDGVFTPTSADLNGRTRFLGLPVPTDDDVESINRKVARKILTLFRRLDEDATPQDDTLAITYAEALQPSLPWPSDEPPTRKGRRCSNLQGFSLHANVRIRGGDRERLERLCRYGLRPPFALERFERSASGDIAYRMKRPAPDGATHRIMTPLDLLGALASLVPPPRVHLTRFHGVFAPHARERSAVVPLPAQEAITDPTIPAGEVPPHRRLPWRDLLKKVFAVDVFVCERCGSRCRVLAAIIDPVVVRAILDHVGLAARAPPLTPARPRRQGRLGVDAEPGFDPCLDPEPSYE